MVDALKLIHAYLNHNTYENFNRYLSKCTLVMLTFFIQDMFMLKQIIGWLIVLLKGDALNKEGLF